MSKVTVDPLVSLTNEPSAVNTINTNFQRMADALELMFSRNGQAPNTLTADLDMNGFKIINLPTPADTLDVVRLGDMTTGIVGPAGPQGPSGSVTDGDKGDVVVSGSGTVWTLDSAVVTTAAKTVLDDATVADMRTTLGLGGAAILNVGTSVSTVAAGNDTRFYQYVVSTQNTDYTLQIITAPTIIRHASATPHAYTINPTSMTDYPVGTQFIIRNAISSGAVTLTRGSGVTLYVNGSTSSANGTLSAGGTVSLIHEATDTWVVTGTNIA